MRIRCRAVRYMCAVRGIRRNVRGVRERELGGGRGDEEEGTGQRLSKPHGGHGRVRGEACRASRLDTLWHAPDAPRGGVPAPAIGGRRPSILGDGTNGRTAPRWRRRRAPRRRRSRSSCLAMRSMHSMASRIFFAGFPSALALKPLCDPGIRSFAPQRPGPTPAAPQFWVQSLYAI